MLPQYFSGFAIERRGRRYYGFCDKACTPVIRDNWHKCVAAMERHCYEHDGQAVLPFPQPEPWKPGDPLPF
jgi:hypothetical protein